MRQYQLLVSIGALSSLSQHRRMRAVYDWLLRAAASQDLRSMSAAQVLGRLPCPLPDRQDETPFRCHRTVRTLNPALNTRQRPSQ